MATRVCWRITWGGIDTPVAAHIHKAAAGAFGVVVMPLGPPPFKASGCVTKQQLSTLPKVSARIVADPGAFYVNVHTRKYLNGAIRGQLRRA